MTLQQRLNAFTRLGIELSSPGTRLSELFEQAYRHNAWFTAENTRKAVMAVARMLDAADLQEWLARYQLPDQTNFKPRKVGLVLAGNVPMVGFHDILCVLVSGHTAMIKLSSQDQKLLPELLNMLIAIEPSFSQQIQLTERLENFDAVIATGSGNTSRYFEYYFGKVPHIIRKNRNSVAVLTGNESRTELAELGHDIFDYFGLGCRNVSKVYVPQGYDFSEFFEAIEPFNIISTHHKYQNNYDYNKSILLLNKVKHYDNGFLLIKEDYTLASALAVLHYQEYSGIEELSQTLRAASEQIQCIVSGAAFESANQIVGYGESQMPRLWDYADGIDTMKFLTTLQ